MVIRPLDAHLAAELAREPWSADAVVHTMAPEATSRGFGFAEIADQRCVGVVGCYACYAHGIEVEIDTHRDYRGRGIASALARAMLAECARRGLSCHWDAMNATSERLALRVGFQPERYYDCVLMRHPG